MADIPGPVQDFLREFYTAVKVGRQHGESSTPGDSQLSVTHGPPSSRDRGGHALRPRLSGHECSLL